MFGTCLQVHVKIISVDGDKVAASMRSVSQEDGRDLDPENWMMCEDTRLPQHICYSHLSCSYECSIVGCSGREGGGDGASRGPLSEEPPEVGSVHKARIVSRVASSVLAMWIW